jgi:DNA modification methylase
MTKSSTIAHRQNAHLTFKHNQHMGRHGWLRLTPAYSVKLVMGILEEKKEAGKVFDPFSGTGTTALCAAYFGRQGAGLEINPFLAWFSSVKAKQFLPAVIQRTGELGASIAVASSSPNGIKTSPPPIHNITRWWNSAELDYLCRLKACINEHALSDSEERDLLHIAFCRAVIKLSNAAFNHQSMSFKNSDTAQRLLDFTCSHSDLFQEELAFVLAGAADNPAASPYIVLGDARTPSRYMHGKYDILITSPPYPNRISYIRELRPYMYWLEYLTNGRDAGEFDWQAVGGTWGIATSRLADWKPSSDVYVPSQLRKALTDISSPKNKNGDLLANYVAKYFEDMWQHFNDVRKVLNDGSEAHYIVGNSTFYGTLLPVEEIYKKMLEHAGYQHVRIEKIRKRNSKAELYEFDVTATMK